MATPLTAIPDHIQEEIFLRLPTAADLARASAACVSFRRLATGRSFLRRFRRLHAPPLLGFLQRDHFVPALPPHPSAPAARALALAADFSFSFLPSHCRWIVQDVRDGRVLLGRRFEKDDPSPVFRELAVCDPLHRRHVLLPPVPDDLAHWVVEHQVYNPFKPFLLPLAEEETEETAFRIIWMAHCRTKLAAFVFSSSTGKWQATKGGPTGLVLDRGDSAIMSRIHPHFLMRHYAYGCFYWDWLVTGSKKLLMLDTRRMEFSFADLPPGEWSKHVAIVEAGEGRPGIFRFHGEIASDLSYAIAQKAGESPSQWQMLKTISLDPGYIYSIDAATGRYLLLVRTAASSVDNLVENSLIEYFSMDAKMLQLQRVCAKQCSLMYNGTHIYADFPPSLLSSWAI
ncbi:unnamed protein product [Triticum turgidum subsp. durum]|uniref:F-box domain-containing protein n=1 Tax=Triticum turgidum subsp. durum TaxID=4567 RepID=A0A9R1C5K3_TRITD|nr:unnamed protein product [Triticum turgidum subsp. durum]